MSLVNHAGKNATSPSALSLSPLPVGTMPSAVHRQGPSPAPTFTKHDLDAAGNDLIQQARFHPTEATLRVIKCDYKALHSSNLLSLRLWGGFSATPDQHGISHDVKTLRGPGELLPFQKSNDQLDGSYIARRETPSTALEPIRAYCATIASPASRRLNYHVSPDGNLYRWGARDGPIPIGIKLGSFKSDKQGLMVQRCLETVVHKLNYINVGPQFKFVQEPSDSAFFVTHGGDIPEHYASAFFPGSHPKDWYIYVYDLALELDELYLIKVLTHEMMHVLGLRHCCVNPENENEPYVRYPHGVSDDDNRDNLLLPWLDQSEQSKHELKPRTVEDLRELNALSTGEWIDGCKIQDISWKAGAAIRRELALNNAC